MSTPTVLSIAGSDPSGGAGIQADLKTFSALGAYGAAVLTALTAQNTQGVSGVFPIPADFVTAQLDAVLSDLDVRAVKTGMLGRAEVVHAVADALVRHGVRHVVVDPVMVATSGDRLVDAATVEAIRDRMLPLATVLTPNLPEAATLLGLERVDADGMQRAGVALRRLGAHAALVKGGHLEGDEAFDVLVDGDGTTTLRAPRVATANTHGTGCTLSSAIAVGLAHGRDVRQSVVDAKAYLTEALLAANRLQVSTSPQTGHGPVHHFARWWEPAQ